MTKPPKRGRGGHVRQSGRSIAIEPVDRKLLPFEPKNENGVVFVFALIAKRLGFEVQRVQANFPDCKARWAGKDTKIEFEYRSSNFGQHRHDPKGCDLIVCWRHDWPAVPGGLGVLELRKVFGLAREVFMVAYRDEFWQNLPDDREPTGLWSVPASAGPGDLLLIYRPSVGPGEEGAVTDVFRMVSAPRRVARPRFRPESDWMGSIQRVAHLNKPLTFSRLRAIGAHGGIESRPRRTREWPALFREIQKAGPSHSVKDLASL